MGAWSQRGLYSVMVASTAVFALCILCESHLPPNHGDCLQEQGSRIAAVSGQSLSEATATLDHQVAVFYHRPWQFSPSASGRTLIAAAAPPAEILPGAPVVTTASDSSPRFVWWKHKRCLCQTLDTPPPSSSSF